MAVVVSLIQSQPTHKNSKKHTLWFQIEATAGKKLAWLENTLNSAKKFKNPTDIALAQHWPARNILG